jgi:hypothetical protein
LMVCLRTLLRIYEKKSNPIYFFKLIVFLTARAAPRIKEFYF